MYVDDRHHPHLFAYAITSVPGQYLTLHYRDGTPTWHMRRFYEIVDYVPVQHIPLRVDLTVRPRFEDTSREWLRCLLDSLTHSYGPALETPNGVIP